MRRAPFRGPSLLPTGPESSGGAFPALGSLGYVVSQKGGTYLFPCTSYLPGLWFVKYMRWFVRGGNTGDKLLVYDDNYDTLMESYASPSTYDIFSDEQSFGKWIQGIRVDVMVSGVLYVVME